VYSPSVKAQASGPIDDGMMELPQYSKIPERPGVGKTRGPERFGQFRARDRPCAVGGEIRKRHTVRDGPSKPDLVTDKSLLDAFPKVALVTIDDPVFGGWAKAQPKHFGDGGIFDQIFKPAK